MKHQNHIFIFAFASCFIACIARADNPDTPLSKITLNGIMKVLEDRSALFIVREPSGREKSCFLSEGQRDGDIQLLSVDMKKGAITVNNHGVAQIISLCKTTISSGNEIASRVNQSITANNSESSTVANSTAQFQNADSQQAAIQSGYQIGASISRTSTADNSTLAPGDQNSGNQNSANSNPSAPKVDPWWIRGSKMVEQARIDSAQAVLDGTADAQPLTPLTPPGTPANLIGTDQLFFEHM